MTEIREEMLLLRKALKMTQQQLSNHLGVTLNTVARWETVRTPRHNDLKRLEELAFDRGLLTLAECFGRARVSALRWSKMHGQD